MGRFLGLGLVVALLAGCGSGTQMAVVPQGTVGPQTHKRSGSWMKREASSEDLIYVTSSIYYPTSSVQIFSYPGGSLVGTLTGFKDVQNVCSDTSGNVWVVDWVREGSIDGTIYEYAHGATSPKKVLEDTGAPYNCSVDSSTGDVAVSNALSIAVYPNGSGSPTYYNTTGFVADNFYITYDGSGNIYFASLKRKAAWIPNGGSVGRFSIKPHREYNFGWDGQYFTTVDVDKINQYIPEGKKSGKPVGSVPLESGIKPEYYSIKGGILAATYLGASVDEVLVYPYPKGGNPNLTIAGLNHVVGVAVSIAPSQQHRK